MADPENPRPEAPLHIVSIDDEPADSRLLEWCVKRVPGWDVRFTAYSDPEVAVAELPNVAADIVLLDHKLGGWDSHAVLARLHERQIDVPVVILTGAGDEELVVEALHSGALDYLPKSRLSPATIRRVVSNAVDRHRLERSVREYRQHLEEVNADLRRRHQEIRRFYRVVSHELRTPLTAAREFISLVRDGVDADDPAAREEHLEIAIEACDEMNHIVSDLSDLSRLETGKFSLVREPCDLGALMRGLDQYYRKRADEQGISFELRVDAELPVVTGDMKRLRQVVSNLLNNALKFTPSGGAIAVRVQRESESAVTVEVEDTGRGIDPARLEHVFERFYQCEEEDATSFESLGLGLSLAKEFVELHGGRIEVESEPGAGTTFRVELPAASASPLANPPARAHEEVT